MPRYRSTSPTGIFFSLLFCGLTPAAALAVDTDNDGIDDAVDVYPCDSTISATQFVPAEREMGMLMFEDLWPGQGDLDFNDVVLAYSYASRRNADGQVLSMRMVFEPLAIGGSIRNGLAIRLPVAPGAVRNARLSIGSAAPAYVEMPPPSVAQTWTVVLSNDLRQAFPTGGSDPINSRPLDVLHQGAVIVLEFEVFRYDSGRLTASAAPYDLFIFRTNDPGHEIHRPEYDGTSAMNTGLFGTQDDGSTSGRWFVDVDGLPFALHLPYVGEYPREAEPISGLFPQITDFAASGGTSSADFYARPAPGLGYRSAGGLRPLPRPIAAETIDASCLAPAPRCDDGVRNGDERGIDCGGNCAACVVVARCDDFTHNGGESGVDCGGQCAVSCEICGDGADDNGNGNADCLDSSCGACALERASVGEGGRLPSGISDGFALSETGRFIAFATRSALVANDTNGTDDVYLRDRGTGVTTLVSVATNGLAAGTLSVEPSISSDGRYVAFHSLATNLVAGDTNAAYDVFVRDVQAGITTRVSVGSSGVQGNGPSIDAAISGNGRYVVFETDARNFAPGDDDGLFGLYVHDRQTGTTRPISVDRAGRIVTGFDASISRDGRLIAFRTASNDVVAGDIIADADVIVFDQVAGTYRLATRSSSGVQGLSGGFFSAISADGRLVAFTSQSPNLVPNDRNVRTDVFVHELATGLTVRVSVDSAGNETPGHPALGESSRPSISANGRYVAFESTASTLVSGDTNGTTDVFVHDLATGVTTLAGPGGSRPAISADGRHVGFVTSLPLAALDSGTAADVYVAPRP